MKTTVLSDLQAAKSVPHFGLEYFVPESESAMDTLLVRIDRMTAFQPLFVSISGGSTIEYLGRFVRKLLSLSIKILVRVDCTELLRPALKDLLTVLKENDVNNIFIVFDSHSSHSQHGGFSNTLDVLKFIKHHFRHLFCICTTCIPEYATSKNGKYEQIETMKALTQSGVTYFITEIIFDFQLYFDFVVLCHHHGITCPIVPTVMPIQSYKSFKKIAHACSIHIPAVIFSSVVSK